MTVGRHGVPSGDAGVTVALPGNVALASVMARKGRHEALARRVEERLGLDLPTVPRRVAAGEIALVWAGPGQWLALAEGDRGAAFEARLRSELSDLASICDQSDGRTVFRVGGPRARDALAKGVMLDLHPRAFGPGDASVTAVAHVGVHLWQLDAGPTYEFAVFRSFAGAFWHWLAASAAEYGLAVPPSASARPTPRVPWGGHEWAEAPNG
jgi:sarcosine oxidase subunit gamma